MDLSWGSLRRSLSLASTTGATLGAGASPVNDPLGKIDWAIGWAFTRAFTWATLLRFVRAGFPEQAEDEPTFLVHEGEDAVPLLLRQAR